MKKNRAITVFVILAVILSLGIIALAEKHFIVENEDQRIPSIRVMKYLEYNPEYPPTSDENFTFVLYTGEGDMKKGAKQEEYKLYNISNNAEILSEETDENGNPIPFTTSDNGEFTLKAGQYAMFEGIKRNTHYEIEEILSDEQKKTYSLKEAKNTTGTLTIDSPAAEFTNKYIPVTDDKFTEINVTKYVQFVDNYERINTDKEFVFQILMDTKDGLAPYASREYDVKENGIVLTTTPLKTDDNGYFSLKENQTAVFKQVKADVEYKVTEINDAADIWWSIGDQVVDPLADYREDVTKAPLTDVYFTNSEVSFIVTKSIAGAVEPDLEQTFRFTLLTADGTSWNNQTYYVYDSAGKVKKDADGQPIVYLTGAVDGVGEFFLKADERALFTKIPVGTKYSVREEQSYSTGYKQVTPLSSNGYVDKTVTGQMETLPFINEEIPPVTSLVISKKVFDAQNTVADDTTYRFTLKKYSTATGEEVALTDTEKVYYIIKDGQEYSYKVGDGNSFELMDGQSVEFRKLAQKGYKYQVIEANPNGNSGKIIYDYVDVAVDNTTKSEISMKDYNDDPSIEVELKKGASTDVLFTNKVAHIDFYFNIEKLLYVDTSLHKNDPEQTVLFKIERYNTKDDLMSGNSIYAQSVFYKTVTCSNKINSDPVNHVNQSGTYKYDANICRGLATVKVSEVGWYKITEVTDWTNTDYDYIKGSNTYLGGVPTAPAFSHVDKSLAGNQTFVAFQVRDVYSQELNFDELPRAQFSNEESEYSYQSGQSYAQNNLKF